MLGRIWHRGENPDGFAEPSLAEKAAQTVLVVATAISFRGLCARLGQRRVIATEIYQVLVLGLLVTLSFRPRLSSHVALGALVYLVYEIVGWSIFDIFVESKVSELHGRRSDLRSFLWAIYSYCVIAWAYGIYYWSSEQILDACGWPLPNAVTGLYYSVVTITTIGYGDYTPAKDCVLAQLLVISEPLVGLVILALYFAVLVSAVSETFRRSIGG